jgi:hypothetical protein
VPAITFSGPAFNRDENKVAVTISEPATSNFATALKIIPKT